VLTNPISPAQDREIGGYGIGLVPVARFVGSQMKEDFYLYELTQVD
jgi:hypothetical protein